ncbi:hypothetical protein TNCV_460031 [Trichonephila clavipes]|nr:hypothetical protein TNCV_460031 [Trichonephila clavipes]
MNTDNSLFTFDFIVAELESAIKCLDPKEFPGPYLIFGQMKTHFGTPPGAQNSFTRSGRTLSLFPSSIQEKLLPCAKIINPFH